MVTVNQMESAQRAIDKSHVAVIKKLKKLQESKKPADRVRWSYAIKERKQKEKKLESLGKQKAREVNKEINQREKAKQKFASDQTKAKEKLKNLKSKSLHDKFSRIGNLGTGALTRGKMLKRPTAGVKTISSTALLKSFARGHRQLAQPVDVEGARRRSVFFKVSFDGEKRGEEMWLYGDVL